MTSSMLYGILILTILHATQAQSDRIPRIDLYGNTEDNELLSFVSFESVPVGPNNFTVTNRCSIGLYVLQRN